MNVILTYNISIFEMAHSPSQIIVISETLVCCKKQICAFCTSTLFLNVTNCKN